MGKVFLLILVLVSAACENTSKPDASTGTNAISYRYDQKHNLCFAMMASTVYAGYRVVSLTHVPLNEERCK